MKKYSRKRRSRSQSQKPQAVMILEGKYIRSNTGAFKSCNYANEKYRVQSTNAGSVSRLYLATLQPITAK